MLLKLYAPADFGVFAFVVAVVGVLAPVASLRYEDALMLPADERGAAHVLVLSLFSLAVISCLSVLTIVFSEQIAALFGEPAVADWVWTIPIILILNRGAKIVELWLSRREEFTTMSLGQVTQSTVMTAVRIGMGVVKPSPAGLIFGFGLGYAASIGLYLKRVVSSVGAALGEGLDRHLISNVARRYRRFPLFTMPAALLGAALSQIPVILLLYFFDSSTLGTYSQAVAVFFIPLSQIGLAVAQVFFVRAAEASREGNLGRVSDTVHKRLVALALYPTALAMIAGPDLFAFVFGETWRASGQFLLYLAPWLFLSAVASPLTRLFDVLERQRLELLTTALMLAVVTAVLVAGGITGQIEKALLYLGVGGFLVRALQIGMLLQLAGITAQQILHPYRTNLAYAAIPLLILVGVQGVQDLLLTFATAVILTLVYYAVIVRRDNLLARR